MTNLMVKECGLTAQGRVIPRKSQYGRCYLVDLWGLGNTVTMGSELRLNFSQKGKGNIPLTF